LVTWNKIFAPGSFERNAFSTLAESGSGWLLLILGLGSAAIKETAFMKILVLGGTRYFGKRLIHQLMNENHQISVLSRGNVSDDFGSSVTRLIADRTQQQSLEAAIGSQRFDVVVDQICMTASDAKVATNVFQGKINHYVMTSTLSVYPWGANLTEDIIKPQKYKPAPATSPREVYSEGKRAAEHYFATQAQFPVGFVRIPIVLGEDDYTLRLSSQIERIKKQEPVFYPNLNAQMGFIHSEDAASALHWMIHHQKAGTYNFATEDVISMRDLVSLIEEHTGKQANLLIERLEEAHSPFGVPEHWYMNVGKAKKEGFEAEKLSAWLSPLIRKLSRG